jgi:hypothetical protein
MMDFLNRHRALLFMVPPFSFRKRRLAARGAAVMEFNHRTTFHNRVGLVEKPDRVAGAACMDSPAAGTPVCRIFLL